MKIVSSISIFYPNVRSTKPVSMATRPPTWSVHRHLDCPSLPPLCTVNKPDIRYRHTVDWNKNYRPKARAHDANARRQANTQMHTHTLTFILHTRPQRTAYYQKITYWRNVLCQKKVLTAKARRKVRLHSISPPLGCQSFWECKTKEQRNG